MKPNHNRPLSDFQESIDIIKSHGFNLIGVSQIYFEDTFIFETFEDAMDAYQLLELDKKLVFGWFYSKEAFEEAVNKYESDNDSIVLIHWLK